MNENRLSGFSLLELTVALSILSLLAWISVPQQGSAYRSLKLKAEADRVVSFLQVVSQEASVSGKEQGVTFTGRTFEASDAVKIRRLATSAEVHSPDSEPQELRFFPSGVATPSTLILQRGEHSCRIVISLRSRIQKRCS